MATITTPKANIPIGTVVVAGKSFDVQQHPEFTRYFFDLFRRVGGSTGAGNSDIESLAFDAYQTPTALKECLTAIDELRNQLDNMRSNQDMLLAQIEELRAANQGASFTDLRDRVETIEGRLV